MSVAGAFGNLGKATNKPSGKKAPKKDEIEIAELGIYARIDAVIKALTTFKTTYEQRIKQGPQSDYIVEEGRRLKKRPANFRGVEGNASASMELRIRSSASALSEEQQEICNEHEIEVVENVQIPTTVIVNPAYATDEKLAKKLIAFIQKEKGFPADYLQVQEGKTTKIVTERSLDQIFALKDEAATRALLPIVGTLAIKAKLEDEGIEEALATLRQDLFGEETEAAA